MAVHTVLTDGTVQAVPEVTVSALDPGFARGESVFETLTVARGRPLWLDAHLDRLERSAAALEITTPPRSHLEALAQTCTDDCVLRLVITAGGTTLAVSSPLPDHSPARRDGITAITLDLGVPATLRARAPWLLGGAKTTSYAIAMAGLREAKRRGADEAIWLSTEGEVLEATTANVAWVTDGTFVTPPVQELGILAGTTLAWAITAAGLPVDHRRAPAQELLHASEIIVTSSIRGIAGVVRLDGQTIGQGSPGPVTRQLVEAFDDLLKG